jgi:hypothetical protein
MFADFLKQRISNMLLHYMPLKTLSISDLCDGRLERLGIYVTPPADVKDKGYRLWDGRNAMFAYPNSSGILLSIHISVDEDNTSEPLGSPTKILRAISEAFDTRIVAEYEPLFWGFATFEDWNAYLDDLQNDDDGQFYLDILRRLRGEQCEIEEGTIGEIVAEIAEYLIFDDATLLLSKDKLLDETWVQFDRDYREDDDDVAGHSGPR